MVPMFDSIFAGLMLWGGIGLAVAVVFLLVGFDKVDPAARDAYAVRPLLLPGLVLLWPLVVWRWIGLSRRER
jgi:hypothetical protein